MYLFLCLFKIIFLAWFISNRTLLFVSWPLLGIHQKTASESWICSVLPRGQLPTYAPASGAKAKKSTKGQKPAAAHLLQGHAHSVGVTSPPMSFIYLQFFQRPGQDCLRTEFWENGEKYEKRKQLPSLILSIRCLLSGISRQSQLKGLLSCAGSQLQGLLSRDQAGRYTRKQKCLIPATPVTYRPVAAFSS